MTRLRGIVRQLWVPVLVGVGILGVTFGLAVALFGWDRVRSDFWPIDHSNVGPNLVASVVVVILVLAHNEYRTIRDDEARHKRAVEIVKDAIAEALHPTETAEQHVADDVTENGEST